MLKLYFKKSSKKRKITGYRYEKTSNHTCHRIPKRQSISHETIQTPLNDLNSPLRLNWWQEQHLFNKLSRKKIQEKQNHSDQRPNQAPFHPENFTHHDINCSPYTNILNREAFPFILIQLWPNSNIDVYALQFSIFFSKMASQKSQDYKSAYFYDSYLKQKRKTNY